MYHKFISQPILRYGFDVSTSILVSVVEDVVDYQFNLIPQPTETKQESHDDFVSSVCLRKVSSFSHNYNAEIIVSQGSDVLLAANSKGIIKVSRRCVPIVTCPIPPCRCLKWWTNKSMYNHNFYSLTST